MEISEVNKSEFKDSNLKNIVLSKKTNVILSLDVSCETNFFTILTLCAPYICGVKIHSDIYSFSSDNFYKRLTVLSEKHNFIIIEDRKLADIGNTNKLQVEEFNKKHIHYFTSHCIMGEEAISSIPTHSKLFLITDMSCNNTFFKEFESTLQKISHNYFENYANVIGFVSQKNHDPINKSIPFILRPGVRIPESFKTSMKDKYGQQYKIPSVTPGVLWVIGREIIHSKTPVKTIQKYQQLFMNNIEKWTE